MWVFLLACHHFHNCWCSWEELSQTHDSTHSPGQRRHCRHLSPLPEPASSCQTCEYHTPQQTVRRERTRYHWSVYESNYAKLIVWCEAPALKKTMVMQSVYENVCCPKNTKSKSKWTVHAVHIIPSIIPTKNTNSDTYQVLICNPVYAKLSNIVHGPMVHNGKVLCWARTQRLMRTCAEFHKRHIKIDNFSCKLSIL